MLYFLDLEMNSNSECARQDLVPLRGTLPTPANSAASYQNITKTRKFAFSGNILALVDKSAFIGSGNCLFSLQYPHQAMISKEVVLPYHGFG